MKLTYFEMKFCFFFKLVAVQPVQADVSPYETGDLLNVQEEIEIGSAVDGNYLFFDYLLYLFY